MQVNSLDDLYRHKLMLIHDAEQQALEAYPRLVEQVENEELRQAMQQHMDQTQQQVQLLQPLVEGGMPEMDDESHRCASMTALIQETEQMLGMIGDADTRDAFLIGAAQAIEHHEIAAYGTVRAWAEQLGREEDLEVIEQILEQEKETDELLTQLAESSVNEEAAEDSDREVPMELGSEMGSQRGRGAAGGRQSTDDADEMRA
ncbi:MAG: DUF892 family protein [Gemmatimonadaceae bacterium]|nr:DUF892 family protein [Gemmatimonadaceae bacterium]